MRTPEWVVVAYLTYVALLSWTWPMRPRARTVVTFVALADATLVFWLASRTSSTALVTRAWLPAAHILIAYWLSGAFFTRPMPHAEAWFARSDRWWFQTVGFAWFAARGPRAILEFLELAYTSAYVVIPVGYAITTRFGPADEDGYWTAVVSATLACYAMLPWVRVRTPHELGVHCGIHGREVRWRRVNRAIQVRGSVRVATIPSGHAAGAMATALAAGLLVPAALAPLLCLALAVALGSVVGRYHYTVDALLGLGVGAVAALLS